MISFLGFFIFSPVARLVHRLVVIIIKKRVKNKNQIIAPKTIAKNKTLSLVQLIFVTVHHSM